MSSVADGRLKYAAPYPKVRNTHTGATMSTATVTTKGQITIPAEVRRRLGLETGDRVEFVEIEDGFAIKVANDDVRALKGLLRTPAKPVTLAAMEAAIRRRGGAV